MDTTTHGGRETVFTSFADAAFAEKAAGALLDHGVDSNDVSLVSKRPDGSEPATYPDRRDVEERREDNKQDDTELAAKSGISTTTPQDAGRGAIVGGAVGLGVGALAAIGSLFVPGIGLVAGGGALATAIAGAVGATAGGAVAGGVHGYLKDQGIPEETIARYTEDYQGGGAILAVSVPSNTVDRATVENILAKYQGRHVCVFGGHTAERMAA